ncbi:melanoma inhibitory activity protein 2 isoform X2 [Myotis myotis]|uniref:Melanoma inhibitory activity protein 2 n=1 Tax=Myotis myotis TaxID=51298 RepID=A0A7J8APB9_MYOMY|nr:melanoma inhibitory activity protein 2 isoform X2 [Myotis myotis]KAF6387930.1 MIA SH3 domain ER export factor 2 [Myotis myotis]
MAEIGVHRILVLVISLTKCLEGTKLLANFKKCADLECETLISRVLAMRDYRGPDCLYLNFTKGEEISVYVKLAGEREDLWAGSKGKDFGYFPRDAVQIEEVFIPEEIQIPTKESDFLCLLGVSYAFENEDSELNSDDGENIYPYEDDKGQKSSVYNNDFQREPGFYSVSESTWYKDQFPSLEAPDDIRKTSNSKNWEGVEAGSVKQGPIPEVDYVPTSTAVPEVKGWFGFGREQAEEITFESVIEQESSFQSRKIAVEDEKDLEKLNNGGPQTEHKQEPESELSSVPKKQSRASESEHILNPQATSWFGGRFTSYLGFGGEETGPELLSQESNLPLQDVPTSISSEEEPTVPCTEILSEKEDTVTNNSSIIEPSWFGFGFSMLGFAYANEDKIMTYSEKKEEGGKGEKHEHPPKSEFDPDKKQEIKIIKIMETEDQLGKEGILEKTDDSDTLPYFKHFSHNFDNPWNFQNDENNVFENDETEEFSFENDPTANTKLMMLKRRHSQSDMISKIELPMGIHEDLHFKTRSSKNNYEKSKTSLDTEGPTWEEIDIFVESTLPVSQMFPADYSLSSQLDVAQKEDASEGYILKFLFQFMNLAFSPIAILTEKVVAALPEDMRKGSNPYGFPWELLVCAVIVGFFAVFLFLWRSFRSVRSRLYVEREKKLAVELSTLIEEKCKLLEKFSLVQKEYEGLESLKDSSSEESTEAQNLEAICEKLNSSKSECEDEIDFLEKELKEEKSKHSEQDELMVDISKRIQSLEDESKSLKSQVAEAKTTFKIFQMNEERLKIAIKDALSENSQLLESQKQLLQEAEEWKEQVSELNKQKITFEDSRVHAKQVLCDKENQIKSLTERLLKMQDWAAVLGEDITDENLELEMKSESENGALSDNEPKGALRKLIHAAKLKASLKTLEGERNQIYTQLTEVDRTKEDLTECIKNIQTEQACLQPENEHLENENQKLQHKLKVMTELYQENEMTLHRKLTVEENYRLEKEEKLSKADEKISHAAEELETYRKRTKDLEEELERTIRSYQGQIISHEKKAHDNWLAARTAERNLNDLKKENSYLRQKLTETEIKFELLEKDPYAVDVPNTAFGREHSPYGPSPLGRPSSETRAFLSPPPLLEGPLRLSPLLPGGGGRGSRGPGNPQDHLITNERGKSSYDKSADPHREPSDTGSLSPPWEHDRRMMIPSSGQPYSDPALPPQRQDRFYSNTGRLSGPAELRSFNMTSLDKADGPKSSEMESSGNDSKDELGNLNVPDASLPTKSEAAGPGFVPPVRGPLFPMDARGPYLRRGPPFPPPPGSMYGASHDYFPPGDFPGPPPPPFAMRNVYSPRAFPHYLPPRAGFFPPPSSSHPESRSEVPSGLSPPSNEPTTE